jgi:hypothetical protein
MKKHWIEYNTKRADSPMTYWVHIEAAGNQWRTSDEFTPPMPKPTPGAGYPMYRVEIDRADLQFASLDELRVCIATLSQKAMPSNMILSRKRGTGYGPSNHWLNRFPLRSMAWPYRQRVVKYLQVALTDFESSRL